MILIVGLSMFVVTWIWAMTLIDSVSDRAAVFIALGLLSPLGISAALLALVNPTEYGEPEEVDLVVTSVEDNGIFLNLTLTNADGVTFELQEPITADSEVGDVFSVEVRRETSASYWFNMGVTEYKFSEPYGDIR